MSIKENRKPAKATKLRPILAPPPATVLELKMRVNRIPIEKLKTQVSGSVLLEEPAYLNTKTTICGSQKRGKKKR
jgi:hypothetical protein